LDDGEGARGGMTDAELEKVKAQACKRASKPRQRSELAEGILLMQMLKSSLPVAYDLIFHIPNGGWRTGIEARNLSLSGVKSGVPDYFLPVCAVSRVGNLSIYRHGLFLELKRGTNPQGKKGGRVSKQQLEWKEKLEQQGFAFEFVWGAEEAYKQIERYLRDSPSFQAICK
jgi:hypothetical protein